MSTKQFALLLTMMVASSFIGGALAVRVLVSGEHVVHEVIRASKIILGDESVQHVIMNPGDVSAYDEAGKLGASMSDGGFGAHDETEKKTGSDE